MDTILIRKMWLRKEGEEGRIGSNRSGQIIKPKGIIIHRTGNPGSSALQNRNYFDTEILSDVYASAHYCVDCKGAIECLPVYPITERGIHCKGCNLTHIGVETSELFGSKINPVTYQNMIRLLVYLLLEFNWQPTDQYIQPHSKYDDINRRYDPFRWVDYFNDKSSPGNDLFDAFKFYVDLQEEFLRQIKGGR